MFGELIDCPTCKRKMTFIAGPDHDCQPLVAGEMRPVRLKLWHCGACGTLHDELNFGTIIPGIVEHCRKLEAGCVPVKPVLPPT